MGASLQIRLKRVYESPAEDDGYRVLVERLWPRGIAKAEARLDLWARDLAPSHELRKWFEHDPERWPEFRARYHQELDDSNDDPHVHDAVETVIERARSGIVTFVFASREERFNNAVALREWLIAREDS